MNIFIVTVYRFAPPACSASFSVHFNLPFYFRQLACKPPALVDVPLCRSTEVIFDVLFRQLESALKGRGYVAVTAELRYDILILIQRVALLLFCSCH
jgi:hypothetical protein